VHRDDELHLVDHGGDHATAAVPGGDNAGRLIDEAHDRPAVNVAMKVRVEGVDDAAESDA
jgi:hypothetical protein